MLRRLVAFAVVALLVVCHGAVSSDGVAAEGADPVTWDEIRQFKQDRKSYSEIAAIIKQRGLAFELDDLEERKLRAYGFSRRLIDQFKKDAIEFDAPFPKPGPAAPADDPPAPAVKPPPPPKLDLDPDTEDTHAHMAGQIKRMIEASECLLVHNPSTHITLIANKDIAAGFLPDIARLERTLREKYPEPIAAGVDLRAANIALLETRYEYEKWTRALFKIFEEDGYQFHAADPVGQALEGESFFVQGIYTICLARMKRDDARRRLAFTVGFQYMRQLTRFKAPDSLATGFGNVTEVMMFQQPTVVVKTGYVSRKLEGTAGVWAQSVKERFRRRQIGSVQNVLAYSMNSMQPPEYAEAWSLTSLLASQPEEFARLMTALRTTQDPWQTVSDIYAMDEQEMLAKWQQFATAQR